MYRVYNIWSWNINISLICITNAISGDNGCHRWCGMINVCNHLTNNKYLSTPDFVFTTILLFNTVEMNIIYEVLCRMTDWYWCRSSRVTSTSPVPTHYYLIPSFHFHFNGMFVSEARLIKTKFWWLFNFQLSRRFNHNKPSRQHFIWK